MSARTRTGVLATRQAASKVPPFFQDRVHEYPGAKIAFEKITKQGFDEGLLWRWLWDLGNLKLARAKRNWYALPGITPRTLRRFPSRVRRLAEEIEKLNAKMKLDGLHHAVAELFLPAAIRAASGRSFDFDVRRLNGIPFLLRLYASYIEGVDRLVPAVAEHTVREIRALEVELLETSKRLTHQHFTVEVSALLTAAYHAVGSKSAVDPRALKMRRSRRSRNK
jgi:hypothetical protein